MSRTLSNVSSKYGAPMGRPNHIADSSAPVIFEVQRLRWIDGDYDQGGAYWGQSVKGVNIFWAYSEESEDELFIRAKDLTEAKSEILETFPAATFADTSNLESFLSSYIEAALWSTTNSRYYDNPEDESENLDDSGYDLAPETESAMRADCADFLRAYLDLISQAMEAKPGYSIEQAGHDFWLTRNGHGVGFWDRGLGAIGDELTEAAHGDGGRDLYVGDDDLIYQG